MGGRVGGLELSLAAIVRFLVSAKRLLGRDFGWDLVAKRLLGRDFGWDLFGLGIAINHRLHNVIQRNAASRFKPANNVARLKVDLLDFEFTLCNDLFHGQASGFRLQGSGFRGHSAGC
jgi:hypothetical protein